MLCNVTTGELIQHSCGRKVVVRCPHCGQEVCKRHFNRAQKVCVECTDDFVPPKGVVRVEDLFEFDDSDYDAFESDGSARDHLTYLDS